MLEKKRLHRFIKSLCCLTFKMFSQASCLAVAYVQPQPSPTRFKNVLLVFSRSKWSMKIQRGSHCIIFFKWKWCDLLLLDTKENANLSWVAVAFSTLINYFKNYLRFLGVTFRHVLPETTTARCSFKEADRKFW